MYRVEKRGEPPIAAIDTLRSYLHLMGFDLDNDENMKETAERFTKYLLEFTQPLDVKAILKDGFEAPTNPGMVVQKAIPFRGVCSHHLLPMFGKAAVGYIPGDRVVGLSKLARIVERVGLEQPGLQETMCNRVADIFFRDIKSKGSIVVITARHACMSCRGVSAPDALTTTSAVRGIFRDVPQARAEFFSLVGGGNV